ncbi:MAG: SRPBCC domain-containing protein [archaeon]|nr:MAG: SRPBCC domain-containing protein [archaeon]
MARFTRTQEVQAPPERVFQSLTDVEKFPELFPDIFKKMEVVGAEGSSRIILCEEKWAGRSFRYKMKETLSPPDKIEHSITEGNGKGSMETINLEKTPGGTRLTMVMDAKGLAAAVLGRLFRKQFEAEMSHIFDGYMKVVEAESRDSGLKV